ncbi:TPM domain-containing protein [Okeania sp. SIO2C2]|uniref:TPM domain-containing protein n=1 Tax=Okeania sp. SIO2C2 TaxID=2607787 RepID=UPI00257A6100|nr:TPM domain-containing protein [Okeania sp. SIO2C2]
MKFSVVIFKSAFWTISLSLALMGYSLPTLALTVQDVPNPRQNYGGWVTDMAEILSTDTEAKLNKMISDLEASNGSEIAVVTVSETQPAATPKKFATELFNYWGIGKKDKDNGVLFLVSQGDQRLEIETGKGVQEILPDAKVSHLLHTNIIPKFKLGLFESGVVAGTTALVTSLETGNYNLDETSVSQNNILIMGIIIIILLVLVFLTILIYMNTRNRPRSSYTSRNYSSYSSYSGGSRNHGSDNHTQRSSYSSIDTNDSDNNSSSDDDASFGGGSSDGGGSGSNWSETASSSSSENFGGGSSSGGGTGSSSSSNYGVTSSSSSGSYSSSSSSSSSSGSYSSSSSGSDSSDSGGSDY